MPIENDAAELINQTENQTSSSEIQIEPISTSTALNPIKEVTYYEIVDLFSAVERPNSPQFINLINQYHPSTLNHLLYQSLQGHNLLGYVAWLQPEDVFILLINRASAAAVNDVMLQQSDNGWNVLHWAARYQSEKSLMALINKVDSDSISNAICMPRNDKWNPLHLVAGYQSEKVFIALLDKATPHSLNQAILQQSEQNFTPLLIAARYQSGKGFLHLMNKIDDNILNQVITGEKYSSFCEIFTYQPIESLHIFLKKLSKETVNLCFSFLKNNLVFSLFRRMVHCTDLTDAIIEKLNTENIDYLLSKLENYTKNGLPLIQNLLLVKRIKDKCYESSLHQNVSFKTSDKTCVNFNDPNLIEIIKQKGFYCYDDIANLLAAYTHSDRQQLIAVIEELNELHLLFEGGLIKQQPLPVLDNALKEKISNYEILYKIIKPELIDAYIEQFKDYTVRPKDLRKHKTDTAYKFQHLTGEITFYKPKPLLSCNKKTIKKNSTTLLSPELITPVFGEKHNDGRPLVGLLFDLKQCNIKAMLKHDIGTVARGWVGSFQDVEYYKKCSTNLNHTNFDQFKTAIQHSSCLNEVLAEIPKEAILGIIICNTRLKSKKIALQYADKIKDTLGIDLTIYHYNNAAKTLLPYLKERIEQHLKVSPVKIAEILRNDLLKSSYNLRFLGGKDYIDPNTKSIKRLPDTAHQIVTNLDDLLQEGNPQKISAELDNIENLLTTKINHSITRTATTVSSYKTNLIQLKNM